MEQERQPNRVHIRRWVDELRSGRYKQAKRQLRRKDDTTGEVGYCCLGVACEISGLGTWDEYDSYTAKGVKKNGDLPEPVADWLGIDRADPKLGRFRASEWNDTYDKSFDEIADLIEAKYL